MSLKEMWEINKARKIIQKMFKELKEADILDEAGMSHVTSTLIEAIGPSKETLLDGSANSKDKIEYFGKRLSIEAKANILDQLYTKAELFKGSDECCKSFLREIKNLVG